MWPTMSEILVKSVTIFILISNTRTVLLSSASSDTTDTVFDLSQFAFMFNNSCDFCSSIDTLEAPPDDILSMPPPPLPPFLQTALAENESLRESGSCNLCHLFHDPSAISEIMLPKPEVKSTDTWLSFLVISVLATTAFTAFCVLLLFKCKKWKIFPMSESCPILPESFLGGHKSAPPPCSPTDSCISPVVNEKSPQSVITETPAKKTSISSKYWKKSQNSDEHHSVEGVDLDPYNDAASCTSSPVYAELDAAGVTHALSANPMILSGPSISPYAVCNTYSEVADAVRMAALGSSSALLPDASYDNQAYLPTSSNIDHYHSRSLRRANRAATLAQLGSTTPLLSSHYQLNGSPKLNYLTGARPLKKPRPLHAQQLPSRARVHEDIHSLRFDRHEPHGSRHLQLHTNLPVNSPSLSTFRVPHAFRDNPKRPLPPVPGVRL